MSKQLTSRIRKHSNDEKAGTTLDSGTEQVNQRGRLTIICRNCGDDNVDFPRSEFCGMCREMGAM